MTTAHHTTKNHGDRTCPRCKGSGQYATYYGPALCALCAGDGITTQADRDWRRQGREVNREAERLWKEGPVEYRNLPIVFGHLRTLVGAIKRFHDLPDAGNAQWGVLADAYGLELPVEAR